MKHAKIPDWTTLVPSPPVRTVATLAETREDEVALVGAEGAAEGASTTVGDAVVAVAEAGVALTTAGDAVGAADAVRPGAEPGLAVSSSLPVPRCPLIKLFAFPPPRNIDVM